MDATTQQIHSSYFPEDLQKWIDREEENISETEKTKGYIAKHFDSFLEWVRGLLPEEKKMIVTYIQIEIINMKYFLAEKQAKIASALVAVAVCSFIFMSKPFSV